MDKEQLNRMLAQVHSELRSAEPMEPAHRKALLQAADDIQLALEKGDDGPGLNRLATRLKSEITQVEANHPSLTLSISELVDALSKIGV